MADVARLAESDARALEKAGFDGVIIENFGDAPFERTHVPPATVAAMTRCAVAVRAAAPNLKLGINVLRNDPCAALGIAIASDAELIRINVHSGAMITDQGLIEGDAARTTRTRRAWGAEHIALLCDVDVKHAAPISPRPVTEEAEEVVSRGLADAVLVTGSGTGKRADPALVRELAQAVAAPIYVASGTSIDQLSALSDAHGVIVGSSLRKSGRAGDPIDPSLASSFAEAFRKRVR